MSIKNPGGTYMHLLRASAAATPGNGSYVSVEYTVPSNWQSGSSVPVAIRQCANGIVTQLGYTSMPLHDGDTIRSVTWGTTLWIFNSSVQYGSFTVPQTTGQPGFGGYDIPDNGYSPQGSGSYGNTGPGNGFALVSVGRHDTAAPDAINRQTVAASLLPNSVSLRWQGAADDGNGVGVLGYAISRNGTGMTTVYNGAQFTDATAQPSTAYSYNVQAVDYHGNVGNAVTIAITTPAAGAIDPRRVGVRSTGAYWGGGGEQIDLLSGNLNFSFPLMKVMGRTGWTFPISLFYNSQNWRQDNGVNWQLGSDVGYGFGWRVLLGSVTPYYSEWTAGVDHYTFTDGSGSEYRLDQNSNGIWTSTDGIYVWFDAGTNILHFKNGLFWVMSAVSGGTEKDAGSLYPTVLEDVHGNQVLITYQAGGGLPSNFANTSSRITSITDVRGPVRAQGCYNPATNSWVDCSTPTYTFTYNLNNQLTGITNSIQTAGQYTFTYSSPATIQPPFGADAAFTAAYSQLASFTVPYGAYQFVYDTAGADELTQVTFPGGGHLRWDYSTDTYSSAKSVRAVTTRYLAADSKGVQEWVYPIIRDSVTGATAHSTATITDASGQGTKTWNFITALNAVGPWQIGLAAEFIQKASADGTVYSDETYTWSLDPGGHPYISTKIAVTDPGLPSQQTAKTTQALDQYGNVAESVVYPFNDTNNPLKIYNNTYVTDSGPVADYVRDRLLSATLSVGGVTKTLVQNTYSAGSNCSGYGTPTVLMDANPLVPPQHRALLTSSVQLDRTITNTYYCFGGTSRSSDTTGNNITASADSATNYAASQTITTQTYSETLAYSSWLGITQATGLNGEQLTTRYDSMGRPVSAISLWGAGWGYTYSTGNPMWQAKTGPDGFTRTTYDGIGHAIRVERGPDANTIQSIVDTVYVPCACSPLGKIGKISQPYAPNTAPEQIVWTAYVYDGVGRTLSIVQPDGASTTTYTYGGNQTTVTDPAGKWKQFTNDVEGDLRSVTEPDPANQPGGTITTSYSYDWMKHLTTVTMPRGGTTQTRTFVYDDAGRLTSATNPENGTVTYVYNTDNTLQYKHDAKGQDTIYSYDGRHRVTMIQRYPHGKNGSEDWCERVTYSYDTNPYDSSGTFQYTSGRLAAVQYPVCNVPDSMNVSVTEMYSYNPAGGVTIKRLHIYKPWYDESYGSWRDAWGDVEVDYSYTGWGAVSSLSLPTQVTYVSTCSCNPSTVSVGYSSGFDAMGRPISMTDSNPNSLNGYSTTWVKNVQYDFAGRLTNWQRYNGTYSDNYSQLVDTYVDETRTYNLNGQLASENWSWNSANQPTVWSTPAGIQYVYAAAQNNGQITQSVESLTGQTISYQYDTLKRLISAVSAPNSGSTPTAWNESFQYDGFGNLTAEVLNGKTKSIAVDSLTNRLSSASYDANGNMTSGVGATFGYDVANRIISATETAGGTEYYSYTAENKRIFRLKANGSPEWLLWGARGEKLGAFSINVSTYGNNSFGYYYTVVNPTLSFAGRTIWEAGSPVLQDRLGTNRAGGARFYPYGEEITGTSNDRMKFGTYTRDGFTGLDYADQRYYASGYVRFNTVDPGSAGALTNPQSLNRYSYVLGDPVNRSDPRGLCSIIGSGIAQSAYTSASRAQEEFANEVGGISVTPYSNGAIPGGVANVAVQGLGVPTGATLDWLTAISIAAQTTGPISIYAFSGSGGAFTNAYNWLTPDIQARITSITYIDPGNAFTPLASGKPGTTVNYYTDNSDLANLAVQLFGVQPQGTINFVNTVDCGHNQNCVINKFADQLSQSASNCDVGAGAIVGYATWRRTPGIGGNGFGLDFGFLGLYWIAEPEPVPTVTEKITYDLP